MEPAQLSFSEMLVPETKTNVPLTLEQKMKFLAEQTRHHLMPQYERLERLEELTKRKNRKWES